MDNRIKSELAFVFSQLHERQLLMIPEEIQSEVAGGIDEEIFDGFDADKPFTEQNLSEETLEILYRIFKDEDK